MQSASPQTLNIEHLKYLRDYATNLTTLSTWAVLVIAVFVEKLFPRPRLKSSILVALVGFIECVFCSVAFQTVIVFEGPERLAQRGVTTGDTVAGMFLVFGVLGFLIGVVSLAFFAIKNMYHRLNDPLVSVD